MATIGITQSVLLAVGIYATECHTDLLDYISQYLLSQLTDIWHSNRPSSRRENFEICLADLLGLINRILWNAHIARHCATKQWAMALLHVLRMDVSGAPLVQSLRPRLLAIALLKKITPHMNSTAVVEECVESMLHHLAESHWLPLRLISPDSGRIGPKSRLENQTVRDRSGTIHVPYYYTYL